MIKRKEHTACYPLLPTLGPTEGVSRIGWAVFDEGSLINGRLLAARISCNSDVDVYGGLSYNVLILQQQGLRYARVGMGELVHPQRFDEKPPSSVEILQEPDKSRNVESHINQTIEKVVPKPFFLILHHLSRCWYIMD